MSGPFRRSLLKKLRQIDALKDLAELNPAQQLKLDREGELRRQLRELGPAEAGGGGGGVGHQPRVPAALEVPTGSVGVGGDTLWCPAPECLLSLEPFPTQSALDLHLCLVHDPSEVGAGTPAHREASTTPDMLESADDLLADLQGFDEAQGLRGLLDKALALKALKPGAAHGMLRTVEQGKQPAAKMAAAVTRLVEAHTDAANSKVSQEPSANTQLAKGSEWGCVGSGRLGACGAPGAKTMRGLREAGVTHLVTLLRHDEPAYDLIEKGCAEFGIAWVHQPLCGRECLCPADGVVTGATHATLAATKEYAALVQDGASVLIHCAAGMHRTGIMCTHRGAHVRDCVRGAPARRSCAPLLPGPRPGPASVAARCTADAYASVCAVCLASSHAATEFRCPVLPQRPLHGARGTMMRLCVPAVCAGYLTLRFCGLEPEAAVETLRAMRPVTHKELIVSATAHLWLGAGIAACFARRRRETPPASRARRHPRSALLGAVPAQLRAAQGSDMFLAPLACAARRGPSSRGTKICRSSPRSGLP